MALVLSLVAGALLLALPPGPRACAHRGDQKAAPENTLPAILSAVRKGAHQVEFDVHLSRDGRLVVIHDPTVDRTTDGTGAVSSLTLAELRRLDAGIWFSPEFVGTPIPTLEEVLAVLPHSVLGNVHLKNAPGVAIAAARTIQELGHLDHCFLACTAAQADEAKQVAPVIRICNMERQLSLPGRYVKETIARGHELIQLHVGSWTGELADTVRELHERGVTVNYFGASQPDPIRALAQANVDYILTDDLDTCLEVLATRGPSPTIERDIVYREVGGVSLRLDLARPSGAREPGPLVLCLHGGGWQKGGRADCHPVIDRLARAGYVAASAEYRLTPAHPWPTQLEDALAALAFLQEHARAWGGDPEHLAVLGFSAGGHLSLLVGLGDESSSKDAAPATRVRAVVNFFGPTDLSLWRPSPVVEPAIFMVFGKNTDGLLVDLVGTAERTDPVMRRISPIAHVDPSDPPVLTIHGASDPLVPPEQATALATTLDRARVRQELHLIEGAGHGFKGPTQTRALECAIRFLDQNLAPER